MKKIITLLLLSAVSQTFAQQKATDLFIVNAGLIGVWVNYEKALTTDLTAIAELGYEGGFFYNGFTNGEVKYIFTTTLGLEGRYYYNFDRRIEKGKSTKNNAANFIALKTLYTPDWGTSSNANNVYVTKTFSIFTKYGIRRNLSNKFNFEFSVGPGYQWSESGDSGLIIGLNVRFGFVF